MLTFSHEIDSVLTDATSVKMSDPTGAYGLRRSDTAEIAVADSVDWVHPSTGEYTFDIDALELVPGVIYDYWIEVVYEGETNWVQQFVTGEGEVVVGQKLIRFVMYSGGIPVAPDSLPVLSSPTSSFGVARIDTGATVVADSTNLVANELLYAAAWGEPAEDLIYRYYIEVVHDGVTYYLPRTTQYCNSAMLVLGRYTNSMEVERRYGVENVHKWLALDDGDEAVDYAARAHDHIAEAELLVDRALGGDFSTDPPPLAAVAASLLAGVLMYEARGVEDWQPELGIAQHRLQWQRRRAEELLKGLSKSAGVARMRAPQFFVSPTTYDEPPYSTVLNTNGSDEET